MKEHLINISTISSLCNKHNCKYPDKTYRYQKNIYASGFCNPANQPMSSFFLDFHNNAILSPNPFLSELAVLIVLEHFVCLLISIIRSHIEPITSEIFIIIIA